MLAWIKPLNGVLRNFSWLALTLTLASACQRATTPTVLPPSAPAVSNPAPTTVVNQTTPPTTSPAVLPADPTALPPSPTPGPTAEALAAQVNGQPIPLARYEREVARCQQGKAEVGVDAADCPRSALDSLIEQAVMEQAAQAAGLTVSPEEVTAAQLRLIAELGSPAALDAWQAQNGYTSADFIEALQRDVLRAKIAAQIIAVVGATTDQVHARLIVTADEASAQAALAEVQAGADFASTALKYSLDLSSRPAGGDVGWFARGALTSPEIEAAAFELQPGQVSGVIANGLGYALVQVLERDPNHELNPAMQQTLRQKVYQTWLDGLLAQATLERFIQP